MLAVIVAIVNEASEPADITGIAPSSPGVVPYPSTLTPRGTVKRPPVALFVVLVSVYVPLLTKILSPLVVAVAQAFPRDAKAKPSLNPVFESLPDVVT